MEPSLCTPVPGFAKGTRKDKGAGGSVWIGKPKIGCFCFSLPLFPVGFLGAFLLSESPTLITCGLAPCPGNAVQPLLPLLDTACLVQISSSLSISTSCLAAMLAVRDTRGLFPTHPSQSQDSLDSICISRHVKSPYSGLRCDLKQVTSPLDSHTHKAAGLGHVCVCMCCFFH